MQVIQHLAWPQSKHKAHHLTYSTMPARKTIAEKDGVDLTRRVPALIGCRGVRYVIPAIQYN